MADQDPIETAWRIHAAQVDWTGKVDSKASFALAIESAVMAGIISLTGDERRLAHLENAWEQAFFWLGVSALVVALVTVAWVVRPRLRSWRLHDEIENNFIYFGHLRKWQPEDLENALANTELLPVLTRQIVAMSKIAWLKHRLLQVSMTAALLGTAMVAVAAYLNN